MRTNVLLRRLALVTVALTCWASTQAASQEVPADSAAIKEIKANLRTLNVAMEVYFSRNMKYTADSTLLDWEPEGDVEWPRITIHSSGDGWAATMGHKVVKTLSCTVYVGYSADDAEIPDGLPQCALHKKEPTK